MGAPSTVIKLAHRIVMARLVRIIRVFTGSPSEVSEERSRLEEVIKEFNLLWGKKLGLLLELVKWETDAYPAIGPEPQTLIDEQIGEYDIFIGILWTKFGTPTSDAASGTEHEFEQAYLRYKQDPESVKIMFYFKDGEILPSQVDAEQLLKVDQFKKRLGGLGALYWTYKTTDEFINLVRVHLTRQLQDWEPTPSRLTRKGLAPDLAPTAGELPSDAGYLDLLEIVETSSQAMTTIIEKMGKSVEALGQKMTQRTEEIKQGHALDQSSRLRYWKRVADAMAGDMQIFCSVTEADIPLFGKSYRQTTGALARAASMAQDFGGDWKQNVEDLAVRMKLLSNRLNEVRTVIQTFRDTIKSTPRITGAFIAAQNHTVAVLNSLEIEYEAVQQHTGELVTSLQALIGKTA